MNATCRACGGRMEFDYEDENWLHVASGSQFCCAGGHRYATGGDGGLIVGCCVRCGHMDLLVDIHDEPGFGHLNIDGVTR